MSISYEKQEGRFGQSFPWFSHFFQSTQAYKGTFTSNSTCVSVYVDIVKVVHSYSLLYTCNE